MEWLNEIGIKTKIITGYGMVTLISVLAGILAGSEALGESIAVTIIVLFIAAILIVALSSFLTHSVTAPIKGVSEALAKIAGGNTDIDLEAKSNHDISSMTAFIQTIAENMKHDTDTIHRLSRGELDAEIKIKSGEDRLAKNCVVLRDTLKTLLSDISKISADAVEGIFETRGDTAKYDGAFVTIIKDINNTLNAINNPINEIDTVLNEIAAFNLSADISGSYKGDFARIQTSVHLLKSNIKGIIDEMNSTISELKNHSDTISGTSRSMVASCNKDQSLVSASNKNAGEALRGMKEIAQYVDMANQNVDLAVAAQSAEKISSTALNLASASEEASAGLDNAVDLVRDVSSGISKTAESAREVASAVNSVATAVKEINISLNEVSSHCNQSIQYTADAKEKATITNQIIDKLNKDSKEIGKIVNVINDIADQTNMLALNAAIEAAGAGESGKGFAVVANEVKELAKQTGEATEEISRQIEAMRSQMEEAVKAVSTITEVVDEVNSITNTITAAVTEQSATTDDITNSTVKAAERVGLITSEIEKVSKKSESMAHSAGESAGAVSEISGSVTDLSDIASSNAEDVKKVATVLSNLSNIVNKSSADLESIMANINELSDTSSEVTRGANEIETLGKNIEEIAARLEAVAGILAM